MLPPLVAASDVDASLVLHNPGKLNVIMVELSPFGFVRCGWPACRISGFYIVP